MERMGQFLGRAGLVLSAMVFTALSAQAADYYVDAVAGDDGNSGASPADAWRTISHATAQIPLGHQTLHVAPGSYDAVLGESFPIPFRGGLTFVGEAGNAQTIVDGGGADLLFEWVSGEGQVTFEGLWLRSATVGIECELDWDMSLLVVLREVELSDTAQRGITGSVTAFFADAGLAVKLERTTIRNCAELAITLHAEAVFSADYFADAYVECEDSSIHDNGAGILLSACCEGEGTSSVRARRSRIEHNAGTALGAGAVRVEDSVVAFNGAPVFSAEALTLERSTIVFNGSSPGIGWPEFLTVTHCILYAGDGTPLHEDCDDYTWCNLGPGGCTGVNGNISVDPLFLDPAQGDFRLAFDSPCIDAGDPTGFGNPTIDGDLDGVERTDIGAFEMAPLSLVGVPSIGSQVQFELWGRATGTALLYMSRGGLVDPPTATPFGELDLDRMRAILFAISPTAPGPPALLPVAIPADPNLIGRSFSFQALSTSTVPMPRAAWTNALTLTIEP